MIGSRVMHRDSRRGRLVVRRRREPRASGLAYGRESRERQLRLECSARVGRRQRRLEIHGGRGPLIDHPFTFECIRVRTLLLLFAYVWFVTAVPGALGLTQEPGFFPRCTAPLLSCSHHATAQRGPPCTLRSAQSPLAPASALWSGIFGCRRPCARPRASGLHPTVHDVVRAMLRCIRSLPLYRSFDARVRARVLSEPQHGTPPLSPTSEASRTPTLIM